MTIQTLYRVQCQPCERYLGCSRPAIANSSDSPLFLTFSSAYDEAVRCGWTTFPLVCPDCAAAPEERTCGGDDVQAESPARQDRPAVP